MAGKRQVHSMPAGTGTTVVSFVLSFLLSLVLVFLTAILIIKGGCFSQSIFIRLIDDNYYQYTLNDIEEKAVDYTLPAGFPISVVDNAFTLEEVKRDVQGYVGEAFSGTEYVPDLDAAAARLSDNVRQYYADGNVSVDNETQEIISSYVAEILAIYRNTVRMPGLDLIIEGKAVFDKYFTAALLGSLILSLVLIILCIKIHKHVHRGLRYVAYATGGTALMLIILPCFLYLGKVYERISLTPQYFYHFAVTFVSRILLMFVVAGIVWLVISICLILLVSAKRKKAKHRHHSHHSSTQST